MLKNFIVPILCCLTLSVSAYAAGPSGGNVLLSSSPTSVYSKIEDLQPFGVELFQGNFSKSFYDGLNNNYLVMPGDRVRVQMWGAQAQDGVLEVDARGNLFLPEIGPVPVEGLRYAELESAIKNKISSVFTSNVEVYVNLLRPQPVAIFVSGFVEKPGRYAGGPTDSVLYFLDLAGGIDSQHGSYRDIKILREGHILASVDLYPFLKEGRMDRPRLEEGDVILVGGRGASVYVEGQVRFSAQFELNPEEKLVGSKIVELALPENKASHVSVVGSRIGAPYNAYVPIKEFEEMTLEDGDRVEFHADIPGDTIMVAAEGAIIGASRYPVHKRTKLKELLQYVAVEPELANLNGIHIRRKSVAMQQKKALNEALQRLEQSSLIATSSSVDEAGIRVHEADLIAQFVEKARNIQPDGTVVVGHYGEISDIYLEDGDQVVIPSKSDVVLISGEVMMPQAVVWSEKFSLEDYVEGAGGYSDRANTKRQLVVKPNGEVLLAEGATIDAGDHLLVLPRYDSKNMQILKDISQILYQVAVAAKVVLNF